MANITAVEMSRTTTTFYTLPYTVFAGFPMQPTLFGFSITWQDTPIACSGGVSTSEPTYPSYRISYDGLTLEEFSTISSTETVYGVTTIAAERMLFGTYHQKIFYSENLFGATLNPLDNATRYFYRDYTPGGFLTAINFTNYALDTSWFSPWDVNQPISWSGLTNAVCLLTDTDDTIPGDVDRVIRGLIVSESGLTDTAQICVAPATAYEGGFGPIHMMIPGAGVNYFIHRPDSTGAVGSMPVWTASDTGTALSSDELSFEAADVNLIVVNDYTAYGYGFWTVTPDAFIFYTDRYNWDLNVGNDPPENGLVIVTLLKDFSSYTIEFVTWGDANAQTILDDSDYSGHNLTVDSATGRRYYTNGDRGTAGSILSEFTADAIPADVLDTMPRFPTAIALGATGGPGFKTSVPPGDRGARFQEWDNVRGTYQLDCVVKDQDQINELLKFFRTRRGRAFPFRFKDWSDYRLPDPGALDPYVTLFITNVTGGTIQIFKTYSDDAGEYVRNITRPVYGTVTLYDNGVPTIDFVLDYSTGIITLGDTLAATTGHVIGITCEFDVKARFDTDVMTVSTTSFGLYAWKSVPIIELFDG